jgi:outer membrane lipase/esterase
MSIMMNVFPRRLVPTSVLAAAILAAGASQAASARFDNLVFFGDSISDSGNVALALETFGGIPGASNGTPQTITNSHIPDYPYPTNGAYFPATLSNGPVWTTQFASKLGRSATASLIPGGTNYAFGGARVTLETDVPSLKTQLDMFLATLGAPGAVDPAGRSSSSVKSATTCAIRSTRLPAAPTR